MGKFLLLSSIFLLSCAVYSVSAGDKNELEITNPVIAFLLGQEVGVPTLTEVAQTIGGIIVYIFSYAFMALIFLAYIFGVLVLMLFKIMFGAFVPLATMDVTIDTTTQSSSYGQQPNRAYGARSDFYRASRTLMPYAHDDQLDYSAEQLSLYERTKAFMNRGVATSLFLADTMKNEACQRYILCQASAAFKDEKAGYNMRFKDMLRSSESVMAETIGKNRLAAVEKGTKFGSCEDYAAECPSLEPAFGKMNSLLKYMGVLKN